MATYLVLNLDTSRRLLTGFPNLSDLLKAVVVEQTLIVRFRDSKANSAVVRGQLRADVVQLDWFMRNVVSVALLNDGWRLTDYYVKAAAVSTGSRQSFEAETSIRPVGRLLTWIVAATARVVPAAYSARYLADLLSELTEIPGRFARLRCAARQVLHAPATGAAFRSAARHVGEES